MILRTRCSHTVGGEFNVNNKTTTTTATLPARSASLSLMHTMQPSSHSVPCYARNELSMEREYAFLINLFYYPPPRLAFSSRCGESNKRSGTEQALDHQIPRFSHKLPRPRSFPSVIVFRDSFSALASFLPAAPCFLHGPYSSASIYTFLLPFLLVASSCPSIH